jgi:hypothetical protein
MKGVNKMQMMTITTTFYVVISWNFLLTLLSLATDPKKPEFTFFSLLLFQVVLLLVSKLLVDTFSKWSLKLSFKDYSCNLSIDSI